MAENESIERVIGEMRAEAGFAFTPHAEAERLTRWAAVLSRVTEPVSQRVMIPAQAGSRAAP